MKKTLCATFVFLMLFASAALASEYDTALKSAKKENKPLLLYFFSKSCGYCTLMDKNTLADKDIAAKLKRDFVYLRVDADGSGDLSRLYRIEGTPSSWFVDSAGKRLFQAPGYIEKTLYVKLLEYVKGKYYDHLDFQAYLKKTSDKK
jgi:thioredoxin-related protein